MNFNINPYLNNIRNTLNPFLDNCRQQAPVWMNQVKTSLPGSIPRIFGSGFMGKAVVISLDSVSVMANSAAILMVAEIAWRILSLPFQLVGLTPKPNTVIGKPHQINTLRPFQNLSHSQLLIKAVALGALGIALREFTLSATNNAESPVNCALNFLGFLKMSSVSYLERIAPYLNRFKNTP